MLSRAGETFPCCRYLHPIEVCLLCGSDPSRQVGQDLRLALAAAGQMAQPNAIGVGVQSPQKAVPRIFWSWPYLSSHGRVEAMATSGFSY